MLSNVLNLKPMYHHLNSDKLIQTTELLHKRICERFPDSGLSKVGTELVIISQHAEKVNEWLLKPNIVLRIAVIVCIILIPVVVGIAIFNVKVQMSIDRITDLIQVSEAVLNEIIWLGIAIFFLITLETRIKRRWILKYIHELRSMAHIIDLHQLTKDPERIHNVRDNTQSSPIRSLTAFELTRYLDYCSEMLSIVSKIASFYIQNFDDPITVTAVNEIENLTTGLSDKIWHKIMIMDVITSLL